MAYCMAGSTASLKACLPGGTLLCLHRLLSCLGLLAMQQCGLFHLEPHSA